MKKTMNRLMIDFGLLTIAMLTIFFFWKNTLVTTISLVIISIFMLIRASKADILFFFAIAAGATIFETLTISSGAWVYSTQHIFIVPLWIPLYWGMGGTMMKDIYLLIRHITHDKN